MIPASRRKQRRAAIRQLPVNEFAKAVEREEQIIKVCMDADFADELDGIISQLKPDYFYKSEHREIYNSICKIYPGQFPEYLSILENIERRLGADSTPVMMTLSKIQELTDIHIVNVSQYVKKVKEAAIRREVAGHANAIFKKAGMKNISMENIKEATGQLIQLFDEAASGIGEKSLVYSRRELIEGFKGAIYLIEGLIEADTFFYIFGDTGTLKSFILIDMGLCIAAGADFHGRKVKQGTVFYVPAEGQAGIVRRICAWCAKHKLKYENIPFFVTKNTVSLTEPESLIPLKNELIELGKKHGEPAMIIFDTLARNFGQGNENLSEDMLRAIAGMDVFKGVATRAAAHHTGHGNKERARASISLPQAADSIFRAELQADDNVLLTCHKVKEEAGLDAMLFSREVVSLLINDIKTNSLVLNLEAEGAEAAATNIFDNSRATSTGSVKRDDAYEILMDLYEKYGVNQKRPRVSYTDWINELTAQKVYYDKSGARRGVDALFSQKKVRFDENRVFVVPTELIKDICFFPD